MRTTIRVAGRKRRSVTVVARRRRPQPHAKVALATGRLQNEVEAALGKAQRVDRNVLKVFGTVWGSSGGFCTLFSLVGGFKGAQTTLWLMLPVALAIAASTILALAFLISGGGNSREKYVARREEPWRTKLPKVREVGRKKSRLTSAAVTVTIVMWVSWGVLVTAHLRGLV